MYLRHPVLQLLLFSLLNAQDTTDLPSSQIDLNYTTENPNPGNLSDCRKEAASIEAYPYHANVVAYCNFTSNLTSEIYRSVKHATGIIISANYALSSLATDAWPRSNSCKYKVQVGADRGKYQYESYAPMNQSSKDDDIVTDATEHDAEIITLDGSFTVLKLKPPIKFSSKVRPIELVNPGDGPKPGEKVTVTIPYYENSMFFVIPVTESIVASKEDCKKLKYSPIVDLGLKVCEKPDHIWVKSSHNCQIFTPTLQALVINDRLAGITARYTGFYKVGFEFHGFFNLAKFSEAIRNITGVEG